MNPPAAVVLLLVAAAVFTGGCRGASPPASVPSPSPAMTPRPSATPSPAAESSTGLPPVSLEEGRISGATGQIRWALQAATLDVDAGREEVRLSRVEAKFLERGALVVTLRAAAGVYSTRTQGVVLSGQVRARAAQGRTLSADRVQWNGRVLIATGHVLVTQERMTVRADRMEGDIALRKARFTGNIKVTVRE